MTRLPDPRNDAAWWTLVALMILSLGATLLTSRPSLGWVSAVSWTAAWLAMARFRWFTIRWWKTWLGILVVAWLLVLVGNRGSSIVGLVLGFFFAFNQQPSLRVLSGKRRVAAFLVGPGLLVAVFAFGMGLSDGKSGDIVLFARSSIQAFWATAALTLLFGMRLHFMRLRPKLFVTGVLVGVIPLVLLSIFGVLLLYGTLGGSRANRARDVLDDWATTYGEGASVAALETPPLAWDERQPGDGPGWALDLVAAVREGRRRLAADEEVEDGDRSIVLHEQDGAEIRFTGGDDDDPWLPKVMAAADTTVWVRVDEALWLVRLRDPAPGAARVDAVRLDARAMDQLARLLSVDVEVMNDGDASSDSLATGSAPETLIGHHDHAPSTEPLSFWEQPRYFGAALIPAPHLRDGEMSEDYLLVTLKTSLADLAGEFISRENVFNIGLIALLGVFAFLLALAALTALVFSLRITGGIVSAVRTLHRGTRRLATGDLEVRIEVPNEDEFGDLADSFNEMTVAVKQGREDALARERLMQEMETARDIQQRLLPHEQPLLRGWEVTGVSIPSLQVGGDYFDFTSPGVERLGVAIGDVSGKGVPAALLMSNLQACLKGQVMHPAPVSDTVTRMNDLLSESTDPHMFATFFYGELDGPTGRFTCTNAGHDPALVVRRDGAVEWISSGGLILGMFGDQKYEQQEITLEPGDVLVLYTDGITEAGLPLVLTDAETEERRDDDEDQLFGEERLAAVVVAARERSALGIREAVLGAVTEHLAGEPQGDDITLVVVKRGEEVGGG